MAAEHPSPPPRGVDIEALSREVVRLIPSLMEAGARSPNQMRAILSQALAGVDLVLGPRMREGIALRIAQLYDCNACVDAITGAAGEHGLAGQDVLLFRQGRSEDDKEQALLALTTKLVKQKGHHARMVIGVARELGVTDRELIEVVALVALNTFVNYLTELEPAAQSD